MPLIHPNKNVWNRGGGAVRREPYVRPADWLTLTIPTGSEEKFVGLFGVHDHDSNYLAMSFSGAYTVDWGDGSAPEDYSSGATAEHKYDWDDLSPSTLTSRGYRQAIVTVTPQSGQQLTVINLQKMHSRSNLTYGYTPLWLDVAINGPNLTSIYIGGGAVNLSALEVCTIGNVGTLTSCSYMFGHCYSLSSVSLFDTSSATSMQSMF